MDDAAQLLNDFEHIILRHTGIRRAIVADQLEYADRRVEHCGHIRQPGRVLSDRRIRHLECLDLRIEGDADLHRIVVVI